MKNFILILMMVIFANHSWATCSSPISRTNNSANTVLTSTKYNTDLNTVYTHVNNMDGDCLQATSIAKTKLEADYKYDAMVSKTTTYIAASTDEIIMADSSGGAYTITLPAAASLTGKKLQIIKTTSDFSGVTIDGNASETINGSATTIINTQYESILIVSNGSNWLLSERRIPSIETSFTPTGSWSTNTTYSGKYRRVGDNLEFTVIVATSGAPTSATFTLNIPSSLVIDVAKLPSGTASSTDIAGFAHLLDSDTAANRTMGMIYPASSVTMGVVAIGAGAVTQAVPFTWANNDKLTLKFRVPISGWDG